MSTAYLTRWALIAVIDGVNGRDVEHENDDGVGFFVELAVERVVERRWRLDSPDGL